MLLNPTTDIAHAIQLAVAPVFLLTGISALLGVMTNPLARIIDRDRQLEQRWPVLEESARRALRPELSSLERRRRLASWAIGACTLAALLVCFVVAALFVEVLTDLPLKWAAAVLFIAAMGVLSVGLGAFLREVLLAAKSVRILTTPDLP
jgi:MFS family permease